MQRDSAAVVPALCRGGGGRQRLWRCTNQRGYSLLRKRISPLEPQENAEGRAPRPPTLAVLISKNCSACGIRCGVHGFAMNPYCSLPLATAPYYREARVTITWRQTACGMRHCFACRVEKCRGRRILVCTPTRSAERQRIVEAEASSLAALNAATPRYGQCNRQALQLFELLACNGNFLWEGLREGHLFLKRDAPPFFAAAGTAAFFARKILRACIRLCNKTGAAGFG